MDPSQWKDLSIGLLIELHMFFGSRRAKTFLVSKTLAGIPQRTVPWPELELVRRTSNKLDCDDGSELLNSLRTLKTRHAYFLTNRILQNYRYAYALFG